jgi:hypothetical protein
MGKIVTWVRHYYHLYKYYVSEQAGQWKMFRNIIFVLMYHRHKLLNLNYYHLLLAPYMMYGNKSECLLIGNPLIRAMKGTKSINQLSG